MSINSFINWLFEGVGWPFLLLIGLISLLFYVYINNSNLPPGPIGLPYLGYYPFFGKEVHKKLRQLALKYGDVFSFTVTGQLYIHLNTIKMIKEAHVTQTDVFTRKPDKFNVFKSIDDGAGIFSSNGPEWKEVRRFILQSLKESGLGRNTLEGHVHEAAKFILEGLRKTNGKPYEIMPLLNRGVTSILTQLLFGGNFEHYEQEILKLRTSVRRLAGEILGARQLLIGPVFRNIMYPMMRASKTLGEIRDDVSSVTNKILDEHKKTFDKDNMRDFIDMYLDERRKLEEKGSEKASYFTDDRLKGTLFQFFIDGTESVAYAIYCFLRIIIDHPEVQEKIQKELDEVVGKERLPSLEDRKELPYTEATFREFNRVTVLFPYVVGMENTRETTLNGYRIPKGSVTVMNMWSAHQDASIYPNPEMFDPGRFLGPDGKRTKTELPILFGVGKRSCVGESMVNMEMFLFASALLQNFTIRPPENQVLKESTFDEILEYEMCAIPRTSP